MIFGKITIISMITPFGKFIMIGKVTKLSNITSQGELTDLGKYIQLYFFYRHVIKLQTYIIP